MIQLPDAYSHEHKRVILKYLVEGRRALSQEEWKLALTSFDLLHRARIITPTINRIFTEVYEQYVDQPLPINILQPC